MADIVGDAPRWRDPVRWSAEHSPLPDDEYKLCVMLPNVDPDDWTPKRVYALNARFKQEFQVDHDIRWIGMVKHTKKRGSTPDAPFYDQEGYDLAFFINEIDADKVGVGHRLDLGFRWFFDVIGQGDGMALRYPRKFLNAYRVC